MQKKSRVVWLQCDRSPAAGQFKASDIPLCMAQG